MMSNYETLEMIVIMLENDDIITNSSFFDNVGGLPDEGDDGWE